MRIGILGSGLMGAKLGTLVEAHLCIHRPGGDQRPAQSFVGLGHAHMQTMQIYTRADPSVKLKTLESVVPPKLRSGRFKATDKLIASLRRATLMQSKKAQNNLALWLIRDRLRVTIHSALYLHYVLDLWVQRWRQKQAHGEVILSALPMTSWRDSNIVMKPSGFWQNCANDSRSLAWHCMPTKRESSSSAAMRRPIALAGSLLALLRWWLDRGAKEPAQETDELFHRMAWEGLHEQLFPLTRR
jgi:hypothetical protein